jgi:hypothetical protein
LDTESERLAYAQWVLERNLQWVGAAEVKTGVVITLDVAMLGALAAAFTDKTLAAHTVWANLLSIVAGTCLFISLYCAKMSFFPRTDGPETSFVFFGRIVNLRCPDYSNAFLRANRTAFLNDLLDQIHRNAEIACDKFRWVKSAMGWSFASIVPWVSAIACLMKG